MVGYQYYIDMFRLLANHKGEGFPQARQDDLGNGRCVLRDLAIQPLREILSTGARYTNYFVTLICCARTVTSWERSLHLQVRVGYLPRLCRWAPHPQQECSTMHRHSWQLSLSSSQLRTYACVVFSFTFDCSFMLSSCLRSRLLCLRVFASLFSLLCV